MHDVVRLWQWRWVCVVMGLAGCLILGRRRCLHPQAVSWRLGQSRVCQQMHLLQHVITDVRSCFALCHVSQHSTAQHSTAQHSTASHSTAQQQKDKARTDRQKSQTISVRADKGPRSLGCFAETMTYAACSVQGTWGCWVREACRAGACWPLQHCSPDASMKSSAASP